MILSTPRSAEKDPRAASGCPPRWAESLLKHVLNPRDRESIPGDLLEEYREERLSNLGRERANLWYIRQMLGIAFFQVFKASPRKRLLICLCFLTLVASAWFGFMETVLHDETALYHPGSDIRIGWALFLAFASFVTILYLVLPGNSHLRIGVSMGAVFVLGQGISAILAVIRSAHFEGYFLLYGVALSLQLVLSILTLAFDFDVPDSRVHL